MLAEKFILLLETLWSGLPDRSQTYTDGGPRVISTSPHIPVRLPAESGPTGRWKAIASSVQADFDNQNLPKAQAFARLLFQD